MAKSRGLPKSLNPWTRVGQRWESHADPDAEIAYRYAPETVIPTPGYPGQEFMLAKDQAEKEKEILQEEFGLGDISLPMAWQKKFDPDVAGEFNRRTGKISILPAKELVRGIIAHELGHAADNAEGYRAPRAWGVPQHEYKTNQHHKYYENFGRDFGNQLQAQRRIEYGESVPKEVMDRMPWLKEVRPMSSNRLASPWKKLQDPEWVTNARYQGERLYEDIEDAKEHEALKRR